MKSHNKRTIDFFLFSSLFFVCRSVSSNMVISFTVKIDLPISLLFVCFSFSFFLSIRDSQYFLRNHTEFIYLLQTCFIVKFVYESVSTCRVFALTSRHIVTLQVLLHSSAVLEVIVVSRNRLLSISQFYFRKFKHKYLTHIIFGFLCITFMVVIISTS